MHNKSKGKNKNKIDLPTGKARQPAEQALGAEGSHSLQQHASDAVSRAESAMQDALGAVTGSGAATNGETLEQARRQLTQADEYLDQAITSANALDLPDQSSES